MKKPTVKNGVTATLGRLAFFSVIVIFAGMTSSVYFGTGNPAFNASLADENGGGSGKGHKGEGGGKGKGGSGKGKGGSKKGVPGGAEKRPPWAKEGIPEVELGRMNVARSPDSVLARALAEALKEINPALYTLPTLDAVLTAIKTGKLPDGTALVRVDSPLQNLALLKDLLLDMKIGDGTKIPVSSSNLVLLAAIFIGSASDKNLSISVDTIKALLIIMGLQDKVTEAQISAIATQAESIRLAILEAHG